jgi:hypothetical protein
VFSFNLGTTFFLSPLYLCLLFGHADKSNIAVTDPTGAVVRTAVVGAMEPAPNGSRKR